jgi:ABC-type branched-subunit amino acid transport system ATPase component
VLLVTMLRKGIAGAAFASWASLRPPRPAPQRRPRAAPRHRAASGRGGALRPRGFLRLLSGEETPDRGRILLHGGDITGSTVTAANRAGIAKSYQINQLFLELTVRQNLRIGALARQRGGFRIDVFRAAGGIAAVEDIVDLLLDQLGLDAAAELPVHNLAYGEKRRLELGLALASLPSVLLLDEPLAGLSPGERQEITELIGPLSAALPTSMPRRKPDVERDNFEVCASRRRPFAGFAADEDDNDATTSLPPP